MIYTTRLGADLDKSTHQPGGDHGLGIKMRQTIFRERKKDLYLIALCQHKICISANYLALISFVKQIIQRQSYIDLFFPFLFYQHSCTGWFKLKYPCLEWSRDIMSPNLEVYISDHGKMIGVIKLVVPKMADRQKCSVLWAALENKIHIICTRKGLVSGMKCSDKENLVEAFFWWTW